MSLLAPYRSKLAQTALTQRIGWVRQVQGLAVDAAGPDAVLGEMCRIVPRHGNANAGGAEGILAEVVGIKPGHVTLMPYDHLQGISAGCEVRTLGQESSIGVGDSLLGRVIDGFGLPLDDKPAPTALRQRPLKGAPLNPMQRPRIEHVLETGVRVVDALLTLGQGQRIGIFAGSGVGKSTLLGLFARHVLARHDDGGREQVNVIALIGERGREVREFIEKQLGPEGLKRSVVVVATSDQPALSRLRATYAALSIAEHFRDAGKHVLLTMDSVTRFAMARREVGLAAGEPPTARGYTPSVFAELPQICERCGTAPSGGAISALFTVLVEGDDMNEPIADALRSILDGHIVLSRHLAHQGQYPAVDVLKSASRLMPDLTSEAEQGLALLAVKQLSLLERNRPMVDIGAYVEGANPELDQALRLDKPLREWLRQSAPGVPRTDALRQLKRVLEPQP